MAAGLKALSEAKPKAQAEVSAKSSAILSEAERKRRLRLAERTYPFYHTRLISGRAGLPSDQRDRKSSAS